MKTKVLLFGMLADLAGESVIEIEHNGDSDSILQQVKKSHHSFEKIKFVTAVNRKMIEGNQRLLENDEVALLPPFSGG